MNTGNVGQGAGAAQAQQAPRDPGPMINGVNTLNKLELGIVGLDSNLALTSIAVSMKRIADYLQMISGSVSNASGSFDAQREREVLEKIASNVVASGSNVSGAISNAIERYVNNIKEQGPK